MTSQLNRTSEKLETKQITLFDRIFRDREGNIVIAQPPNLPSLVGIAAALLTFILPSGKIHATSELFAFGAGFTWAWQELFAGVNYFRRSLGLIALIGLILLGLNIVRV